MERNEMIEIIIAKASITREEAIEVLEKCNWDIIDSIIYLEKNGKIGNNETTTIIEVKEEEQQQDKKRNSKKHEEKYGGIGEMVGRMFKFIGKLIRKGNENYFEIKKENEKPMRISLTISILLLIFLSVPTIVLLIIGLFCGYKYSLSGDHNNYDDVNNVFEKASESADNVKNDFKKGYAK
ncbi:DUF4342 domain-containing protein [Clostridium botulinum]|uniref:DUF4342 domain-containing protein n=1 Tax=Clostridium botulinum TaxID=1491 RepID=UPI0007E1F80F|nr:DUF4342 domain-containing protein [Clostridium botulinum]KEI98354.1 ubiquitin [Clostridium botulinum F 357]MBE1303675.1 DUF4342 domain-containing protein [Clostridium botulinum]